MFLNRGQVVVGFEVSEHVATMCCTACALYCVLGRPPVSACTLLCIGTVCGGHMLNSDASDIGTVVFVVVVSAYLLVRHAFVMRCPPVWHVFVIVAAHWV